MLTPASLFNLETFSQKDIFSNSIYAWDALKQLKEYLSKHTSGNFLHRCIIEGSPLQSPFIFYNGQLRNGRECQITFDDATKGKLKVTENGQLLEGASVIMAGAVLIGKNIQLGSGVLVESGAYIKGPVIIGNNTEIRQGAYIRGNCIFGDRCVVGHTTEVKHSIFLNDAKAGHFAYLGDSILGNNVNLGAGTKFANLRFLPGTVKIKTEAGTIDSGLRKIGGILGDNSQTGCNSVCSPGTILGQDCLLLPNTTAPSGFHPSRSLIKTAN